MSGVQLDLPKTPQPQPRSPLAGPPMSASPSPQTALTFTAEWDLAQRAFVFTPFETSYPSSATSLYPSISPVPDDVQSLADTVALTEGGDQLEVTPASPSSSVTTPCSEIFDDVSVYSQDDPVNQEAESTAPSSASAQSMSPHGLYCKPGGTSSSSSSSSSLTRQITLHLFEEELQRATQSESNDSDFDKGCYEEMDEDLLRAPMDVFERMLWDAATEVDVARLSRLLPPTIRFIATLPDSNHDASAEKVSVPLPPLGPGIAAAVKPYSPSSLSSPESPAEDITPPSSVTVSRHSRNLSFPTPARQRPKGPRRKRNLSADIATALRLKR